MTSLATLLALAIATGSAPATPARSDPPSAEEIVARNVAARGGREAWQKVRTMTWSGHVESSRAPAGGLEFTLEQKRPNRTRLEIASSEERSVRVFDGFHGWKVRTVAGRRDVQPYTIAELRYAQAGDGIDGPLVDLEARGGSVSLKGEDEVDGRPAYHLEVRRVRGGVEDVWIDAATWLDVRHDRVAETGPAGGRRISTRYGDYRTVDGLRIPFLIETGGGPGASPDRLRVEKAVLDAPIPDARFRKPTEGPAR